MSRASLEASFEFAKKTKDPLFREFLSGLGFGAGKENMIVVTTPEEPVSEVIIRLNSIVLSGNFEIPFLIAVKHPGAQHGFAMFVVSRVTLPE